jgi:hypothetical protein
MARYNSLNPKYARAEYLVVLEWVLEDECDDNVDPDRIIIGCFGGYGRAVYQAKHLLHLLAAGVGDKQPYEQEDLKSSLNCEGYPLWYGDVHARESGLGNYMIRVFPKM